MKYMKLNKGMAKNYEHKGFLLKVEALNFSQL